MCTPMALKLFCDLYGNSSVGNLDKNSLVITKLFQKKINSVEESYRKQEKETNQQSMIKTILVNIATLLTNKNELTFEDIFNESREPIKSHLEDLLVFIEKEGFIYSHQICKTLSFLCFRHVSALVLRILYTVQIAHKADHQDHFYQ